MRKYEMVKQLKAEAARLQKEIEGIGVAVAALEGNQPVKVAKSKAAPVRRTLRRHIPKVCAYCKGKFMAKNANSMYCKPYCCHKAWEERHPGRSRKGRIANPTTGPYVKTLLHGDALSTD